ncbi:MAG: hypothetical protein ACRDN0_14255 [Trebonia sp.]
MDTGLTGDERTTLEADSAVEPEVLGQPGPGRLLGQWCRRHPRTTWAAALALAALALFLCYLRGAQTQVLDSDPAGQVLQAWQIWHGNPLLHGWWLGDVTFYTVELPLYVVIQMIVGLRPGQVHIAAAIVYTAVVLLAALLARGRARGWEGIVRALLAAGIMLAPSALGLGALVLEPDHIGTMIPVLLALLVVDRAPQRWWVAVVVAVLLTWAQVNDPQATVSAGAAVAAVCGVRACAEVARRQRPRGDRWYDVSLVAAALISIGAAHVIVSGIHSAGGFYMPQPKNGLGFVSISAMPAQSWAAIYCVLILFGADFIGQPMGISALFALLHLVGAALGLWALGIGLRGFFTRMDRVNQVAVAGTIFILGAGSFGYYMSPVPSGAHEIVPVLPFCAVLAGRLLGGRLVALRLEPVLAAGLAVMLAALAYAGIQPKAAPAHMGLATWLQAHHLTSGLASYWYANITTLSTQGRVRLVAVVKGGTTAEPYESYAGWYNPARYRADFIVSYDKKVGSSPVEPSVVWARYGRPARVYHYEGFTIMMYNYNLLTRVTVPAGPWPGYRPG